MAPATWEEQQSGGAPSRCGRCGSAGRQVQQQGVQRARGQGVQRGGSEMSAVRRKVSQPSQTQSEQEVRTAIARRARVDGGDGGGKQARCADADSVGQRRAKTLAEAPRAPSRFVSAFPGL